MEKPDSIIQKETTFECRKVILELIKSLSDKTNDKFEKEAFRLIAKDVVEAPNMRDRLELAHREIEEDWQAMFD